MNGLNYSFKDGLCPHCNYKNKCYMRDDSKVSSCASFNIEVDAQEEYWKKIYKGSLREKQNEN